MSRRGHQALLSALTAEELKRTLAALETSKARDAAQLLREALRIDAASRGSDGRVLRDYFELEEEALARLDREAYGLLEALRRAEVA